MRVERCFMGACLLAAAAGPLTAGSIGLRWQPSTGATGYKVHYGPAPGQHTVTRDVGNVTETLLSGLPDCAPTYFAVSAYGPDGESAHSGEISSLPRPSVASASPAATIQGSQVAITLSGANFEPGAVVTIDNPDVFLGSALVGSCNQIQILATVEPTSAGIRPALVGKFDVTVSNSSTLAGSKLQAFEVRVNPVRFDVNRSDAATRDRVDGHDTVRMARRFGGHEPDAAYDPDYDLNGDGWIDGDEIAYLAANLGRCWSPSAADWSAAACTSR